MALQYVIPFEYAGAGKPIDVKNTTPVEILFEFEGKA